MSRQRRTPPDVLDVARKAALKRRSGRVYEDGSFGVRTGGRVDVFDPDTGRVRKKIKAKRA